MKLCIMGTGYVGLVTGTCLADLGNEVICVSGDENKINLLRKGKVPIYEPDLNELVEKNVKENRLFFDTDSEKNEMASVSLFVLYYLDFARVGGLQLLINFHARFRY